MNRFLPSLTMLLLLSSSLAFAGTIELQSLKDVAVAHQNDDGTYNVICANGNRETVTAVDVRLGNVCPNDKNSEPTQILSLQRRSDGQFDVVCRDLTKVVASEEQIIAGQVCTGSTPPPVPEVVIEDGVYVSSGRLDCLLEAQHLNGELVALKVTVIQTNLVAETTCRENFCTGKFENHPRTYKVRITSPTTFEYTFDEDPNWGPYKKK